MAKVLFIGNSYTFYNRMPKIFEKICRDNGIDMTVSSVTEGGVNLSYLLSDETKMGQRTRRFLDGNSYDYVVFQEQSMRPITEYMSFLESVKYGVSLALGNGAKPVLYETWGRADFSEDLKKAGITHDAMQKLIREAYEKAAYETGCIPVYAGERFHESYRKGEDVFMEDGTHPNPRGSEIIAEEFYRVLYGKNKEGRD